MFRVIDLLIRNIVRLVAAIVVRLRRVPRRTVDWTLESGFYRTQVKKTSTACPWGCIANCPSFFRERPKLRNCVGGVLYRRVL